MTTNRRLTHEFEAGVEALEVKGFTYALKNPKVKRIKLAYLRILPRDYAFVAISVAYVACLFWLGSRFSL